MIIIYQENNELYNDFIKVEKESQQILQKPDEKSKNKFIVKIPLIKYCTAHSIVIYTYHHIPTY